MTEKKIKIEIAGMEGKKKVDFKLKLIKGVGCFRLVAIDKNGEEYSIVEVEESGFIIRCVEDLRNI